MMRQPLANKSPNRTPISQSDSGQSPVLGWNTRDSLAAMDPRYAITLDNWVPTAGGCGVRDGSTDWATGFAAVVKSTLTWNGPSSSKLFGATNAGIYEATSGGAIGALVQARTEGYCLSVNYTTSGGQFLCIVNGADNYTYYNGTTWMTVATFVLGAGTVATNLFSNVSVFKRQLFFIEKNSMNFYHLAIDTLTGTCFKFPLGALFSKGGYLVAAATWTVEGGLGSDDYAVFATSEGQLAVYKGTDPASASTWELRGIYDMPEPLGAKCFYSFGADLLFLTNRGLFSLTKVLNNAEFQLKSALTDVIGDAFQLAADSTGTTKGWEVVEYFPQGLLLINIPTQEFVSSEQYVMNTRTGAWCRFKGWNVFCFATFNKKLYGGTLTTVTNYFTEGNDNTTSITAEAKTGFRYYSPRSRLKDWKMIRPNLVINGVVSVNVALDTDFGSDAQFGAAVFNSSALSRWDTAVWDTSQWSSEPVTKLDWVTVTALPSYCAATRLRVIARDATILWPATDVLFESGAMV
jgi:hypothetical protein